MFDTQYSAADIALCARKDLNLFLDANPSQTYLQQVFHIMREKASENSLNVRKMSKLSVFVEEVLLQSGQQHQLGLPLAEGSPEQTLLVALEHWLRYFTLSHVPELDRVFRAPRILEFGRYVVAHILKPPSSCKILTAFSTQESGLDLRGFPSCLLVSPSTNDFVIIFDDNLISDSAKSVHAVERIYEMLALHEIGHARLHGQWLTEDMRKTKQQVFGMLPLNEDEAWTYAYAVIGYIVGLRAQIYRLLGRSDSHALIY